MPFSPIPHDFFGVLGIGVFMEIHQKFVEIMESFFKQCKEASLSHLDMQGLLVNMILNYAIMVRDTTSHTVSRGFLEDVANFLLEYAHDSNDQATIKFRQISDLLHLHWDRDPAIWANKALMIAASENLAMLISFSGGNGKQENFSASTPGNVSRKQDWEKNVISMVRSAINKCHNEIEKHVPAIAQKFGQGIEDLQKLISEYDHYDPEFVTTNTVRIMGKDSGEIN